MESSPCGHYPYRLISLTFYIATLQIIVLSTCYQCTHTVSLWRRKWIRVTYWPVSSFCPLICSLVAKAVFVGNWWPASHTLPLSFSKLLHFCEIFPYNLILIIIFHGLYLLFFIINFLFLDQFNYFLLLRIFSSILQKDYKSKVGDCKSFIPGSNLGVV